MTDGDARPGVDGVEDFPETVAEVPVPSDDEGAGATGLSSPPHSIRPSGVRL